MKRIYLLLILLLISFSVFSQVLTITEVSKGKTYTINGIVSGNELIASVVDDNTVRLYNKTYGSSNDYKTTSNFTDFVINSFNPTDVNDAVFRINNITNFRPLQLPYYLNVHQGKIPDEFIITKFGRNGSVGTSLTHISVSGEYQTPLTAQSLEILSASAADNPAGAGAHKVIIEGLDGNFDIQLDTVTMNGVTPVALNKQFIRVFRGRVFESGSYVTTSVSSHIGQITLRNSGAGVTWFIIDTVEETATGFGMGQTQIGTYTIPRGHTAYLLSKTFSVESTKEASIYFFKREFANDVTTPFSGIMQLFEQNDGVGIPFTVQGNSPLNTIVGPAEVGFFSKVPATSASVSVEFQLLVKKNL